MPYIKSYNPKIDRKSRKSFQAFGYGNKIKIYICHIVDHEYDVLQRGPFARLWLYLFSFS